MRDALPVRLLVSGILYGCGKRNEATVRTVARRPVNRRHSRVHSMSMVWLGGREAKIFGCR